MKKDISKLSAIKINSIFLEKIKDYSAIMKNFLSEEELEERKNIVLDELGNLITTFDKAKSKLKDVSSINSRALKDIKIASGVEDIKNRYLEASDRITSLITNEIEFLHFFTTDFSSEEKTHGIEYSENGEKFYSDIDTCVTYAVIRNLDLLKKRKNEPFNYPKELEEDDNRPIELVQIKDRILVDMLELFNDDFLHMYFLGKGNEFNERMMNYFTFVADNDQEAIFKVFDENPGISDSDAIDIVAKGNRKEFDEGIKQSVRYNKESSYDGYVNVMINATRLQKEHGLLDKHAKKSSQGLK